MYLRIGDSMKKIKYLLTTILLAIIMLPMVFAKDEVKIESYELIENSETTSELSKPKIDGLTISFDLSFSKVKDFAKYKIVVDNPTTKDYEISKDIDFDISDYIDYSYEFEKDNNIVKADSKMTMFIVVTYAKEVPASMMKDGKFIENNKMAISLSNDNASSTSKEENPNTASSILIVCVLGLTISLLSLILFAKTKKQKYITTFVLSLLLMPATIFALEKLQINVATKITIEEKYKVSYITSQVIKESEKSNYDLVPNAYGEGSSCVEARYRIKGDIYIECGIYLSTIHYAGENIEVKEVPISYIDSRKKELCTTEEDGTLSCPEDSVTESVYGPDSHGYIMYSRLYNETSEDNDLEVMNIQNIYQDSWEFYGRIYFNTPSRFTMPKHDVYFHIDDFK